MTKDTIDIGKTAEGTLNIDLPTLVDTRLLVQANSGGGKSFLIRRLLEQSYNKVQHIILDLEGEFSTLREHYDYLLVGKGGDIPISIKTAELLAKKILELNISTIIDLYELKQYERILFVKRFLEAMINAPKELWHPCLVVIDEAHIFAPESGKCEAMSAVIDLCTRGRKRGYSSILATQRLSKLHKDTAAEANNVLIGRTGLDVDMKRAAETLGFTHKTDMLGLRNLEPGEFFAFGPAISRSVTKVKIGAVKSTHMKVGMRQLKQPTTASNTIRNIVEKLRDLPQEAEKELKTVEDYKKEIHSLRIQLGKQPTPPIPEKEILRIQKGFQEREREKELIWKLYVNKISQQMSIANAAIQKVIDIPAPFDMVEETKPNLIVAKDHTIQKQLIPPQTPQHISSEQKPLRDGAMRMLGAVAQFHPKPISRNQIATLTGFTSTGGTYNTYLSELKRNGWILESSQGISITESGLENITDTPALPTDPQELISLWASKFREGAAKMLKHIASHYPEAIHKDELGEATGFTATGGTFNTYLSELRRSGLIEIEGSQIRASKELFPE